MKGVMLLTYGTPDSLGDVERYYTHILGGTKPPERLLADLTERYRAIGGRSPLARITQAQADKLERRLSSESSPTKVYYGMKHSRPFIDDSVRQASEDGVTDLLVLPLAPHFSKMSTGTYAMAVEIANNALKEPMNLEFVNSWHMNPILIEAWATRIERADALMPDGYSTIFSAHSLPEKILSLGDPYRDQLLETSSLVAARVGMNHWSFAFQSKSHSGEAWLGPEVIDHMQDLFDQGSRSFLVAPVGFVSDHLEVLYDLDIECKHWADNKGVKFARCDSLNDSDDFIECLLSIVKQKGFN